VFYESKEKQAVCDDGFIIYIEKDIAYGVGIVRVKFLFIEENM
jgi:hypothetical protein